VSSQIYLHRLSRRPQTLQLGRHVRDPGLDEPSEFAIATARLLLMPFFFKPSYCLCS
jgi:hypothetical protein